jgi:hypothetical protein
MAKIKLNLNRLNPDEIVGLANQIKTAMTSNASFPTPNPTLTALGTLITTASTKVAAQKAAAQSAQQATTDRDAALDALRAGLTLEAAYVENASGGDPVKIQSAGMGVRAPNAPVGPLGQVQNLSLSASDDEGGLDAQWDPVRGAKSYEIQECADPITSAGWHSVTPSSKSRATLTGLTPGQRLWARVRAIGKGTPGAWSDPAVKMVP